MAVHLPSASDLGVDTMGFNVVAVLYEMLDRIVKDVQLVDTCLYV